MKLKKFEKKSKNFEKKIKIQNKKNIFFKIFKKLKNL